MKNILNIIITFFFCQLNANAQSPYTIGETFKIYSNILNEDRIIDIQLPKNYFNEDFGKGKYPVIYVLDGDTNFPLVAALERFSTKFLFRSQPEMIVVGIRNVDRTKDYTPTKSFNTKNNLNLDTSGGAGNFINFINKELKPFVNNKFRTTNFNILHGHSFGGLFAIYTLLNHTDSFDAYIAIDPSLWWDNKIIYNQAKEVLKTKGLKNKSLFIAFAQEKNDSNKKPLMNSSIIGSFCAEVLPTSQLKSSWKYYPDYNHGSVPIPSSYDALKSIFEGIELPIKEITEDPQLIITNYNKLSEKLNHQFIPEESLLIELIKYTKRVNKKNNAEKIIDYALQLYPESKQLKKMKAQ